MRRGGLTLSPLVFLGSFTFQIPEDLFSIKLHLPLGNQLVSPVQ